MAASTSSRADDIRAFVVASALEIVISNIALEAAGIERDDPRRADELFDRIWPKDERQKYDEVEDLPGWRLVDAEDCALAAQIYAWLASDEGRKFAAERATFSAALARRNLSIEQANRA